MQVAVDKVSISFPKQEGKQLAALGPVTFDVASASFVAILGPSGCGKSTLIRAIAGLQAISFGTITVGTQSITEPHQDVGIMFQDATLMPWRTVYENIALPLEIEDKSNIQKLEQVNSVLPLLGLSEFKDAYPSELSGGMAQRVALGRVLVQQPNVLLLDEPFGALDAMTREKISFDLLKIWSDYQQTILMVTHDINEAVLLADRVIVLSKRPGRIIADIDILLPRPRHQEIIYTQEFVELARQVRNAIDRA